MFADILQMTLNGLVIGFSIMLIALGFALVLGVMHIVNFAHSQWYMMGAYGTWFLLTRAHINYWLALVLATVVFTAFGVVVERYLLRPLRGMIIPQVVVTIGLLLILEAGALVTFGTEAKAIPPVFTGTFTLMGARISVERIALVLISALLLVATLYYWQRGKGGKAMRAVSQDADAARLQGVSLNRTAMMTMGIGVALAAVSGALLGPVFMIAPTMGGPAILRALIVITLAGMGSIGGVVAAALVVGMIDSFASSLVASEFAAMLLFLVLMLMLVFRPRGFWGYEYRL